MRTTWRCQGARARKADMFGVMRGFAAMEADDLGQDLDLLGPEPGQAGGDQVAPCLWWPFSDRDSPMSWSREA